VPGDGLAGVYEICGLGKCLSLDGPEFLHDAHRKTRGGLPTFDATIRGIRHLQAAGLNPPLMMELLRADVLDVYVATPESNDRLAFQLVCSQIVVEADTMLVVRRMPGGYKCEKSAFTGDLGEGQDVWTTITPLPYGVRAGALRIGLPGRAEKKAELSFARSGSASIYNSAKYIFLMKC
jgi:hypothetical protein